MLGAAAIHSCGRDGKGKSLFTGGVAESDGSSEGENYYFCHMQSSETGKRYGLCLKWGNAVSYLRAFKKYMVRLSK